jgi:hypothetical protein
MRAELRINQHLQLSCDSVDIDYLRVRSAVTNAAILNGIKLLHTAVWSFFALCVVLIPIAGAAGHLCLAIVLIGVVLIECLVLALNRAQCPLTVVARRYTEDRADNFDIYLPLWLARHNKLIFGILYIGGTFYVAIRWWTSAR